MQRERESLAIVLDNNPYGITVVNKEGKWIYVNPTFTEITGYTLEDIPTGRDWFQKTCPDSDYREMVINSWKKDSMRLGRGDDHEFKVMCKDGQVKRMEFRTTYLKDRSVSVLTDVTLRKLAEKSLFEAKLILENISDIAYIADTEGNVTYVNPAAEKMTGVPLEEIIGRPFLPLFVEKDHQSLIDVYMRTLAGESLENTLTFTIIVVIKMLEYNITFIFIIV